MEKQRITNHGKSDLGIGPDMVVPGGGFLDVTEEQAGRIYQTPVVESWVEDKILTIGRIPAEGDDNARFEQVRGAIDALKPEEDFTKSGKPDVDKINAILPDDEGVNGKERDAVWAEMNGDD